MITLNSEFFYELLQIFLREGKPDFSSEIIQSAAVLLWNGQNIYSHMKMKIKINMRKKRNKKPNSFQRMPLLDFVICLV